MPLPVAVAVAPVLAALATFAVSGADQPFHVQLHQPLRHVADHLPQNSASAILSSVIGFLLVG